MDEELERLVVRVYADTKGFIGDVNAMKSSLESGLGAGVDKAARAIEMGLARAIRTGKLGFDDLKQVALSAMAQIASSAISTGIDSVLKGAGGGAGLISAGTRLVSAALGLPGRATGGPVTPGRAYMVGERGPEMFVPTTSGRIETGSAGAARPVNVAISIAAPAGGAPDALARSGRQVARAVRRALDAAER